MTIAAWCRPLPSAFCWVIPAAAALWLDPWCRAQGVTAPTSPPPPVPSASCQVGDPQRQKLFLPSDWEFLKGPSGVPPSDQTTSEGGGCILSGGPT